MPGSTVSVEETRRSLQFNLKNMKKRKNPSRSGSEFTKKVNRFRRLWIILTVGILLTVLGAWWMYSSAQFGYRFWFLCLVPFLLN
jgi:FtsH-binding integral membrane protein